MDRRHFLKSAAVTAAAGPTILGADDKAGTKLPRVGTGEHTYECHHNWGELPAGFAWQTSHNVAVDSAGLVYITHQAVGTTDKLDTVVVFDPAGKFVRSFGGEYHAGGHGIDIRKEGNEEFAYLANMTPGGPVVKCSLKGEVVWTKGPPAESKLYDPKPDAKDAKKTVTPVFKPTNVAFLPDGGFYVGDGYGSHYMHKYDAAGNWQKSFGGAGNKPGELRTPHGQWVDARNPAKPVLVVCDRANNRLQTFTLDGESISVTKPNEVVHLPANVDIRGDVMMVPDLQTRVTLFDKDNRVITHLGGDEAWRKKVVDSLGPKSPVPAIRTQPSEWPAGKFVHPHDACFDKDGNIFVVEWVSTGRVTFLKKVG
jgi:hypothetical protein